MQKDASRRRFPLADRVIEVIDDTLTGEVLLDEALKMMKQSEKMSVASWIDLMSGMQRPSYTHVHIVHISSSSSTEIGSQRQTPRTPNSLLQHFSHMKIRLTSPEMKCRRDLESHEDRLPAEAGARAAMQGAGR